MSEAWKAMVSECACSPGLMDTLPCEIERVWEAKAEPSKPWGSGQGCSCRSIVAILDRGVLKGSHISRRTSWPLRKEKSTMGEKEAGRVDMLSSTVQLTKVQWFQAGVRLCLTSPQPSGSPSSRPHVMLLCMLRRRGHPHEEPYPT